MLPNWVHLNTFGIGGLILVGFAPQSDYLLVVSHQGRGVFDCLTGRKIARDSGEYLDYSEFEAEGIGILANQTICVVGLFGGNLPNTTTDDWKLSEKPEDSKQIFLSHKTLLEDDARFVGDEGGCEMRAFGFSETGNSFVIATSCDLIIYAKTIR